MSRKIAIVGSRNYPDTQSVIGFVKQLPPNTIVISGGARGVDSIAENTAKFMGLNTLIFKPDYGKFGCYLAPKMRNQTIVDNADELIAFQYNNSSGTEDTIQKAKIKGIKVTIFNPKEGAYMTKTDDWKTKNLDKISYAKLKEGWGLRGGRHLMKDGATVTVTKRDGTTKTEVIDKIVWWDETAALATILKPGMEPNVPTTQSDRQEPAAHVGEHGQSDEDDGVPF